MCLNIELCGVGEPALQPAIHYIRTASAEIVCALQHYIRGIGLSDKDVSPEFPTERTVLDLVQSLADASSEKADKFCAEAGKNYEEGLEEVRKRSQTDGASPN
jgi:hypothetical protein